MSIDVSALLDRFHTVLIEEIRKKRPEYLRGPFTVAEIYQDLVPYRTHRDALGIAMNGDYEDAVLRLLSGEGGYLLLESEPARKQLVAELESKNPNTGVFREFAAAEVRLNPAFVPEDVLYEEPSAPPGTQEELALAAPSGRPTPDPAVREVWPIERLAPDPPPAAAPAAPPPVAQAPAPAPPSAAPVAPAVKVQPPTAAAPETPAPAPGSVRAARAVAPPSRGRRPRGSAAATERGASGACPWCKETLPDLDAVLFCPYCGGSQEGTACASCGTELEPGWRYCIGCGHARSG